MNTVLALNKLQIAENNGTNAEQRIPVQSRVAFYLFPLTLNVSYYCD